MSMKQHLKVYRGRVTDRSFFKALWQPLPLLMFPTVLFASIVNGAFITWMVVAGMLSMQVLMYPPYKMQPDTLAYIGLPGSIVGLIFAVIAGLMNDWMIKKLAKRNNGIYEPEFRLLFMIPATIFTTLGFLLVGPAYERKAPVAQLVGIGLLFPMGVPFAASSTMTYIFDTQGKSTTEAFVATSLFRSIFMALAAQYVPDWFHKVGPRQCFNTLAVLNLCIGALTIPMWIFGKRLRGFVSCSFLEETVETNRH
jgi:hypothetical protein